MYVYMYICMYVSMFVSMYVRMCMCICQHLAVMIPIKCLLYMRYVEHVEKFSDTCLFAQIEDN